MCVMRKCSQLLFYGEIHFVTTLLASSVYMYVHTTMGLPTIPYRACTLSHVYGIIRSMLQYFVIIMHCKHATHVVFGQIADSVHSVACCWPTGLLN